MEKEQALLRLSSLENEAKELRKIIESSDDTRPIKDRVKTFDDALRISKENFLTSSEPTKDEIAYRKLKIIAEVLNEGWKPDWSNCNEYKYYPYFEAKKSGFGFSGTYCAYWSTGTTVGSRLCFKTRELAIYAGKQFEDIYNDFLTL